MGERALLDEGLKVLPLLRGSQSRGCYFARLLTACHHAAVRGFFKAFY